MNHTTRYTDAQFIIAVKKSKSTANVCRLIGIVPIGGNYKTVRFKIKQLKLNTSHFTRQGWSKGMKFPNKKGIPLDKIMIKNSHYSSTHTLKKRAFAAQLFEKKCVRCERTKWYGKPIPLEFHHKNGDHFDHRLKNIEILCPNCHAFTDNYRGRNV